MDAPEEANGSSLLTPLLISLPAPLPQENDRITAYETVEKKLRLEDAHADRVELDALEAVEEAAPGPAWRGRGRGHGHGHGHGRR